MTLSVLQIFKDSDTKMIMHTVTSSSSQDVRLADLEIDTKGRSSICMSIIQALPELSEVVAISFNNKTIWPSCLEQKFVTVV